MNKKLVWGLIIAAAVSLMVVCVKAPQYVEGAAAGWEKIIGLADKVE